MKIAVIGAGAIGCVIAGFLKKSGHDVFLAGRPAAQEAIKNNGLKISGARGDLNINLEVGGRLVSVPELAILAPKTQDLEAAIKENLGFLKNVLVITTQNGVAADEIAAGYIPKEDLVTSIVMFGSTCLVPGEAVYNFDRAWVIGRPFSKNDDKVTRLKEILGTAFEMQIADDIWGMKYLKIFVNANNSIPAILGSSMQESFADGQTARISIAIWKEGLRVVNKAGIKLASLPDFPLENIVKLTSLPIDKAAEIFTGIMKNLSKEPLYGSILQSIKRGKPSEIDYINGEFVKLAKINGVEAPLNEKLTAMVHEVEKSKRFFTREELINNTKAFVD